MLVPTVRHGDQFRRRLLALCGVALDVDHAVTTDEVRRGRLRQAAAPYLGQIALYAAALQHAVGEMPAAALHFLRPGASYEPDPGELRKALAATRARIDAGELLAEPEA